MLYTPLTKKALDIACKVHQSQKDKAGAPYLLHVFLVMENAVKNAGNLDKEVVCCVALLHDCVEDGSPEIEKKIKENFPKEIYETVSVLTRRKENTYREYIEKCKTNLYACICKKEDLKHNMDITRYDNPSDIADAVKRNKTRYERAYRYLNGEEE